MRTHAKLTQAKSRKKNYIFGIIILVVLVLGFGGWKVYSDSAPKPLGDKLAYIGKKDFGWYTFFLFIT